MSSQITCVSDATMMACSSLVSVQLFSLILLRENKLDREPGNEARRALSRSDCGVEMQSIDFA